MPLGKYRLEWVGHVAHILNEWGLFIRKIDQVDLANPCHSCQPETLATSTQILISKNALVVWQWG